MRKLDSLVQFAIYSFFADTAFAVFDTLSLHDALPISGPGGRSPALSGWDGLRSGESVWNGSERLRELAGEGLYPLRSEEHTSELQSRRDLVCRLLLEKKKAIFPAVFAFGIEPSDGPGL